MRPRSLRAATKEPTWRTWWTNPWKRGMRSTTRNSISSTDEQLSGAWQNSIRVCSSPTSTSGGKVSVSLPRTSSSTTYGRNQSWNIAAPVTKMTLRSCRFWSINKQIAKNFRTLPDSATKLNGKCTMLWSQASRTTRVAPRRWPHLSAMPTRRSWNTTRGSTPYMIWLTVSVMIFLRLIRPTRNNGTNYTTRRETRLLSKPQSLEWWLVRRPTRQWTRSNFCNLLLRYSQ